MAAHLPSSSRINRSVIAWTIPASGVRPPARTFVAVRAIAPVAGMPPKIGEMTLATPCATSSTFDLCLVPTMPSATTAESNDSIAASSARVNAGEMKWWICPHGMLGQCGIGSDEGTEPNREPIVSTGRLKICTAAVASTMATKGPGTSCEIRGQMMSTASDPSATRVVARCAVPNLPA